MVCVNLCDFFFVFICVIMCVFVSLLCRVSIFVSLLCRVSMFVSNVYSLLFICVNGYVQI